jgi:dehydrodolichyl diphosphate syntase complex subunit NUS1
MLNSIWFYLLNSLYSFLLFINSLFGGKTIKNLLEVSFGPILNDLDENKKNLIPPSHLAIAYVDKELISYVQLYDLVLHSSSYGVKRVTFYDPWSLLKSDSVQFIKGLKRYLKERRSSVIPIINYETPSEVVDQKNYIHISILDSSDGREALVKACKKISKLSREIKIEDIDEQLIEQSIFEPDLLIKVGTIQSLAGYPPWSLRVSEIISIPTLSYETNFTISQFEEILLNFSRRERRLGR